MPAPKRNTRNKNIIKYGSKTKNQDNSLNPFSQRKSRNRAHTIVNTKCKRLVIIETLDMLISMENTPKKRLIIAGVHKELKNEVTLFI